MKNPMKTNLYKTAANKPVALVSFQQNDSHYIRKQKMLIE